VPRATNDGSSRLWQDDGDKRCREFRLQRYRWASAETAPSPTRY